jgi:hypothetical protein
MDHCKFLGMHIWAAIICDSSLLSDSGGIETMVPQEVRNELTEYRGIAPRYYSELQAFSAIRVIRISPE